MQSSFGFQGTTSHLSSSVTDTDNQLLLPLPPPPQTWPWNPSALGRHHQVIKIVMQIQAYLPFQEQSEKFVQGFISELLNNELLPDSFGRNHRRSAKGAAEGVPARQGLNQVELRLWKSPRFTQHCSYPQHTAAQSQRRKIPPSLG